MTNLLTIPFKKSYVIDVKEPLRNWLYEHGGTHPNAFKDDIDRWQALRNETVGTTVHVNRVQALISYHAQLVCILAKLPTNIQLEIPYAPAFNPSALPITLRSLAYERACTVFNLAALYSHLAAAEDRSNQDGIKRAIAHYQSAAGTLSYLMSAVLPKLDLPLEEGDEPPADLSMDLVKSFQALMLAQAQECGWQNAKLGTFKNGVIARLAEMAATLYRSSAQAVRDAPSSISHDVPPSWLAHIEAKQYHFEAVAQYRKSMDELEANRYGVEIARLGQAQASANQAYDTARRAGVSIAVIQDAKSLLDIVAKNIARAERDNDLIYHQDVPAPSSLPPIQGYLLVKDITVPPGLSNTDSVVPADQAIFRDLLGWAAQEAIEIYDDRKKNLVEDKIVQFTRELDERVDRTLSDLNLPSSLEALERPIGLPPSLLKKAEEVRLENGPTTIEATIEDVQRLAKQDMDILNEAMDILDEEASEDEAARKEKPLPRAPSHEANIELTRKEKRYRDILNQAADSDEVVRLKWDDWEPNIVELTWDEADLEAAVPSSTVGPSGRLSAASGPTQANARNLRVLLEKLDDLTRARKQTVERAQRLCEADDIRARIARAATGFSRWADMTPAMFEDHSDEELAKYDKFILEIDDSERKQDELLENIRTRHEAFVQSRKGDPSVKEREHALQSLDLAYHKYREIKGNLEEGFKFYNDLADILLQFKETCRLWSAQRKQEIHALSRSMRETSTPEADGARRPGRNTSTPQKAPRATPRKELGRSSLSLPPIDSSEWEYEPLDLPPGPGERR
ncbi:hypothetical protein HGRIS_003892 [Hohenbuehelia grisea]|uniref:BRO1 domain-containing protein n=1 Tax=Hohenbuehelia grisea TaxID=104357 RepID=A0ABR3JHU5_9AGAR